MKALTAAEMREVDRLTIERHGISGLQLMENAGNKAADAVWYAVAGRDNVRVCVLCGKGNNGGDGFVVARCLKEAKLPVQVILLGKREEVRGDAAASLSRWLESGEIIEVTDNASLDATWPRIANASVIVDALLGTGLRGPATGA